MWLEIAEGKQSFYAALPQWRGSGLPTWDGSNRGLYQTRRKNDYMASNQLKLRSIAILDTKYFLHMDYLSIG